MRHKLGVVRLRFVSTPGTNSAGLSLCKLFGETNQLTPLTEAEHKAIAIPGRVEMIVAPRLILKAATLLDIHRSSASISIFLGT